MTTAEWKCRAQTLERIVIDLHWMSRRYADGRSTYATSLLNEHVRTLLDMGVPLNPTGDDKLFARDAMGDHCAGLTPEDIERERAYCEARGQG